jgi:two-component system CheB/CheR fusion protein
VIDLKEDPDFEELLQYLKRSRGFDFTGYKRSSLLRRVGKRMDEAGVANASDYIDYLEVHPDEFTTLFNTILINVTSFFRDPSAWEALNRKILPQIIQSKGPGEPIRAWAAGCATGEEAFTLALLLAEHLGREVFEKRVKIYATDVDEDALRHARQGRYSAKDLNSVPAELREAYFEPSGGGYIFRNNLRRSIIFGRNDLVQDAPISRLDLLISRNTLMYFTAETQARILAHFHFALNDAGYLMLGKAEMLMTHPTLFQPADLRSRIFFKVPRAGRDRLMPVGTDEGEIRELPLVLVRELGFELSPLPQIIVDLSGDLAAINAAARMIFGLSVRDVGRPLRDLEISFRPTELRSRIEEVIAERHPVTVQAVDWLTPQGRSRTLDVSVNPLSEAGTLLGVCVSFHDVTQMVKIRSELERSRADLETAYEELQSSNEELETMNEELQSTVEELQTTNEELQSSNEELETMNEELQATNEELEATNEELQVRTDEVDRASRFSDLVLGSLRSVILVVDRSMRVQRWGPRAQDQWGLRNEEALGHPVLDLDIGLPVQMLSEPLRAAVSKGAIPKEITLDAVDRRGRSVRCRVTVRPVVGVSGTPEGAVIVIEPLDQ